LIGGAGLAIHPNEIIARVGGVDVSLEHLSDRGILRDFDVIGKAATVIINYKDFHNSSFKVVVKCSDWQLIRSSVVPKESFASSTLAVLEGLLAIALPSLLTGAKLPPE